MNSRSLLDYLAYSDDIPDDLAEPAPAGDPLEARLKDLEARLRANQPAPLAPRQDLTLSSQIEAILKRKAPPQTAPQPSAFQPDASRHARSDFMEPSPRTARAVIDPPPSVPVQNDRPAVDQDFLKFSEAVYLIGQAARRFIEEPQSQVQAQAELAPRQIAAAPSTGDIEALCAVLRETVSAFRSVADDLAVSAGEIRNHATRQERLPERKPERQPEPMPQYQAERRRPQPARHRDEDEILELQETIADLQFRLDDLLQTRRHARY